MAAGDEYAGVPGINSDRWLGPLTIVPGDDVDVGSYSRLCHTMSRNSG